MTRPSRPGIALALICSIGATGLYASTRFVPDLVTDGADLGYDAYRYHLYAESQQWREVSDIFQPTGDDRQFEQIGYPVLLTLFYKSATANPFLGCLLNWCMWVAAGFLLLPLARSRQTGDGGGLFLAVWLLYPEAVTWNGMTTKESLVVLILAVALKSCASDSARKWRVCACVIAASATYYTRALMAPVLAGAFAAALCPRRWKRVAILASAALFVLYVASGETAGYARMQADFMDGLSDGSVLTKVGSENRIVDALWVPVRGLANIAAPAFLSPFGMEIEERLSWLSAVLCCACVLAICLRVLANGHMDRGQAVSFAGIILGVLVLGMSGVIHARYRSIIVPALLPIGMRAMRDELAERSWPRLLLGGAMLAITAFSSYRLLRA